MPLRKSIFGFLNWHLTNKEEKEIIMKKGLSSYNKAMFLEYTIIENIDESGVVLEVKLGAYLKDALTDVVAFFEYKDDYFVRLKFQKYIIDVKKDNI